MKLIISEYPEDSRGRASLGRDLPGDAAGVVVGPVSRPGRFRRDPRVRGGVSSYNGGGREGRSSGGESTMRRARVSSGVGLLAALGVVAASAVTVRAADDKVKTRRAGAPTRRR